MTVPYRQMRLLKARTLNITQNGANQASYSNWMLLFNAVGVSIPASEASKHFMSASRAYLGTAVIEQERHILGQQIYKACTRPGITLRHAIPKSPEKRNSIADMKFSLFHVFALLLAVSSGLDIEVGKPTTTTVTVTFTAPNTPPTETATSKTTTSKSTTSKTTTSKTTTSKSTTSETTTSKTTTSKTTLETTTTSTNKSSCASTAPVGTQSLYGQCSSPAISRFTLFIRC